MSYLEYWCLPLLILGLTACNLDPVEDEEPVLPPIIELFSAEPLSVNEGDQVALSLKGSGIDSCEVTANGEKLSLGLSLTQGSSHVPSRDTEYEISCIGAGGEVKAKAAVNIIIADDVIKADSLAEIAKYFDINAVKALALEGITGELKDFDPEYKEGTVSLSENYPDSISMSETAINKEHSILYGYEGNHDFDAYSEQCKNIFDSGYKPLYGKSQFSAEILAKTKVDKEFVIPNQYHVSGFEAVTQSLENPIPQGTEWDVSFDLAQTKISYSESFTDFGEAAGIYAVKDDKMIPIATSNEFQNQSFSLRLAATFPNGYPIPPKTSDYDYDPNHSTCNTKNPEVTTNVYFKKESEYCAHPRFKDEILCKFPEPGVNISNIPGWHSYTDSYKSIDTYIEKFSSKRVLKGNELLQCGKHFPSLASQYGLGNNWTMQTVNREVLFFNNTPNCSGINCSKVYPRLTSSDPSDWNVEPANNQCIDRWKEHPWDSYLLSLQTLCQGTEVYKEAVAKANQADNDADMIRECIDNSRSCKDLVESLRTILDESYSLTQIESKFSLYEKAKAEALKSGESYLIPYLEPKSATPENKHYFISRLSDFDGNLGINSHILRIKTGYDALVTIHEATKGDWNTVLSKREVVGIPMSKGFQSPEELKNTIDSYMKVLGLGEFEGEGLNEIAKPILSELSCSYNVKGRLRKFSDLKIISLSNEAVSDQSVRAKLQSIAPVVIE